MVPRKTIKFSLTSNLRKSLGRSTQTQAARSLIIIFGLVLALVFLVNLNLSVVNSSPIRAASDPAESDHGSVTMTMTMDSKRDVSTTNAARRENTVQNVAKDSTHAAHPVRQAIESKLRVPTKNLPSFDKGGLVFFLHIPKTGGTTIRENLHNRSTSSGDVLYRFVAGMGEYNQSRPLVDRYIRTSSARKRPILFLEVHGRDSPNLLQLRKTLLRWKRTAAKSKVPTFFFTILREPLSHAVSYFNFFHVDRPNRHFEQVEEATEENFLRLALHSPQCQFLSRGEYSLREKKKVQTTGEECHQVQDALLETMDWVGTTDRMNDETLPILTRLLNLKGGATFEKSQRVSTKLANATISKARLGASTVHTIEDMLSFDRNIYEEVPKNFPLAMWKEYASQK
jgi:hypothetical protein